MLREDDFLKMNRLLFPGSATPESNGPGHQGGGASLAKDWTDVAHCPCPLLRNACYGSTSGLLICEDWLEKPLPPSGDPSPSEADIRLIQPQLFHLPQPIDGAFCFREANAWAEALASASSSRFMVTRAITFPPDTPIRRYADTPIRRYADTPIRPAVSRHLCKG
jgi:hypothetical protein